MDLPHIPNLIYYAIPFFILSVIIEGISLFKKDPESYNIKETFASLTMGVDVKLFSTRLHITGSSRIKPIVFRQKLCGNFNYLG